MRDGKRFRYTPHEIQPPPRSAAVPGALVPGKQLRTTEEPSFGGSGTAPFDYRVIQAVPASGTLGTVLVGAGGAVLPGQVPMGFRGGIFGFAPYLEDGGGPVAGTRIAGAGVSIIWRLFFDGRPAPVFSNVSMLLDGWDFVSPYLLCEIPEATNIRVTVDYTDPGGLYSFLGIRVRGYWEPWKRDVGKAES